MTRSELLNRLEQTPIVAAIKDDAGLAACLTRESTVVFILYGSITTLPGIVEQLTGAGKAAIVHVDLIEGLAPREASVDYISAATQAHGIISTKPALLARARQNGLLAIRRFFLLDSIALRSIQKQFAHANDVDLIEVLPGVMPKILQKITGKTPIPVIAGGLISDKEDVLAALGAGAVAVSTTEAALWGL